MPLACCLLPLTQQTAKLILILSWPQLSLWQFSSKCYPLRSICAAVVASEAAKGHRRIMFNMDVLLLLKWAVSLWDPPVHI